MLIFENCSFSYTADAKGGRPFIVGVKDREHSDDIYSIKNVIRRRV